MATDSTVEHEPVTDGGTTAAAERKTERLPEWKRAEVEQIAELLAAHESVGVVDITGIPSRQLQQMRADLHGTAVLRVSRNTLLGRALEDVDEGIEAMVEYVSGQVGLVATNENPFALYRELEASKTPAPIGAGEVAPNDIVIEAGDTGIDPGPFVGDLQQVGANARIEDGSIRVVEDSTVLEAGEEVTADLEGVLNELGIEAKEVGLDLRAVYADGVVFEPEDLDLDVDAYRADVRAGAGRAYNLAVNAEVFTAASLPAIVARATADAKSLGLQAAIESPSLTDDLVATADAQVRTLAAAIDDPDALPEELQGVEPAAPPEPDQDESSDDQPADEADDADDDAADGDDAGADDDDDDDDSGAEGLGAMFG